MEGRRPALRLLRRAQPWHERLPLLRQRHRRLPRRPHHRGDLAPLARARHLPPCHTARRRRLGPHALGRWLALLSRRSGGNTRLLQAPQPAHALRLRRDDPGGADGRPLRAEPLVPVPRTPRGACLRPRVPLRPRPARGARDPRGRVGRNAAAPARWLVRLVERRTLRRARYHHRGGADRPRAALLP